MANYDASIRVSTKIDTSQMQKLQIQIDKATDKVASLSRKYDELKNKKIPTQEYTEIVNQIAKAEAEFNRLLNKRDEMIALEKTSGSTWDRIRYKMEVARDTVCDAQDEMDALVKSGKAFTIGASPDEIAKAGKELSHAQAELQALNTKQNEVIAKQNAAYEKMAQSGKKAFNALSSGAKNTGGLMSTLTSRLKGITLSLFVFNWITKGFNAMVSSMRQGFQNLAKYSNEYNTNMSQFKSQLETLKNSLAAAFAPLVNMALPYLTQFVSWLNVACDAMARFFAMLQGKDSYTRATQQVVNYKKTLESATKAAAKLAGFDDINVLQQDDSGGSGGGAGGGTKFEEVKIEKSDGFLDKLVEDIKNSDWAGVFNTIVSELDIFLSDIEWTGIGESISEFVSNIDWLSLLDLGGTLLLEIPFEIGLGIGNEQNGTEYTPEEVWEYLTGASWLEIMNGISDMIGEFFMSLIGIGINLAYICGVSDMTAEEFWEYLAGITPEDLIGAVEEMFNELKAKVMFVISWLTTSVTNATSKVKSTVIGIFEKVKSGIVKILQGVFDVWSRIINKLLVPVRMLVNALKVPINGIIGLVEKLINSVLSGFNGLIEKLNSFRIDIPSWVPQIGGSSFGFNLASVPPVKIPRLANGGITNGSILANIGEAGREAVLPLENNTGWMDDLADKLADRMPKGYTGPVYLQIDGQTFARLNLPYLDKEKGRIGLNLRMT